MLRFARSSRSAGNDDNVVELTKPLGLVLNQDDNGNVYVETVAPRGNAARTGKVCSMSFVNAMVTVAEFCGSSEGERIIYMVPRRIKLGI